MRLTRSALGQAYPGQGVTSTACGADPCDWTDYLWVSDECSAWLQCAGQPAVSFGSELAQGASYFTSALSQGVGGAVSGAVSSPSTDIFLALLAAGAVGLWILLDKL